MILEGENKLEVAEIIFSVPSDQKNHLKTELGHEYDSAAASGRGHWYSGPLRAGHTAML